MTKIKLELLTIHHSYLCICIEYLNVNSPGCILRELKRMPSVVIFNKTKSIELEKEPSYFCHKVIVLLLLFFMCFILYRKIQCIILNLTSSSSYSSM